MFRLDAEHAHEIGIGMIERGLASHFYADADSVNLTPVECFGFKFRDAIGMAAGFDKNGVIVDQLASLGFGAVEVGTVTFEPQTGNSKPRMFRLPKDNALINRLGFNNRGAFALAERLCEVSSDCVVGVNIGKNKNVANEDAVDNYLACLNVVHSSADYLALNISSPNTPGLRELQNAYALDVLLKAVTSRNIELGKKPILVKIAPDLENDAVIEAVDICLANNIDGIIATNTTISRKRLKSENVNKIGDGGLSGFPLRGRSTDVIRMIFRYTNGRIPIVGVGGVFSAEDAFEKIAAGATLIQAYTGFIYGGPRFAQSINKGLKKLLDTNGFADVMSAVGSLA